MTPPTELQICLISGRIATGNTITSAAHKAGVDLDTCWEWLAAGRERTCPMCAKLVMAVRMAGEVCDSRTLKSARHDHAPTIQH